MTKSVLKARRMDAQTEHNRAPSTFGGCGWRGNIATWTISEDINGDAWSSMSYGSRRERSLL